jgi:hypothetical protein
MVPRELRKSYILIRLLVEVVHWTGERKDAELQGGGPPAHPHGQRLPLPAGGHQLQEHGQGNSDAAPPPPSPPHINCTLEINV